MKNKQIVSILDSSIASLCNIEASLLSLDVDILCCDDISKLKESDIIITNTIYVNDIINLNIKSIVIVYGGIINSILPDNFIVLNILSSAFDIKYIVEYLIEPNIISKNDYLLKKIQESMDNRMLNEDLENNKLENRSLYINIYKKTLEYVYAFVEYLYEEMWITKQVKINICNIMREITETENQLIININNIIFSYNNGGSYLSIEYCKQFNKKNVLYILGFKHGINKNTKHICKEVLIKSV